MIFVPIVFVCSIVALVVGSVLTGTIKYRFIGIGLAVIGTIFFILSGTLLVVMLLHMLPIAAYFWVNGSHWPYMPMFWHMWP